MHPLNQGFAEPLERAGANSAAERIPSEIGNLRGTLTLAAVNIERNPRLPQIPSRCTKVSSAYFHVHSLILVGGAPSYSTAPPIPFCSHLFPLSQISSK